MNLPVVSLVHDMSQHRLAHNHLAEVLTCLPGKRLVLTNSCYRVQTPSGKLLHTSVASALAVLRLASLGASMLVSASVISGGGPFLGGPRMTTAPPSITCFTTPFLYCLGAAAAAVAGVTLSVWSCWADMVDTQCSIQVFKSENHRKNY